MWHDLTTFKSLRDRKPVDPPSDAIAQTFMYVSSKCTQNNYKKRCSMDEVFNYTLTPVLLWTLYNIIQVLEMWDSAGPGV